MKTFEQIIHSNAAQIQKVVDFRTGTDHLFPFDFTQNNTALTDEILLDTGKFSNWIEGKLKKNGARYGIGGYNEHRTIYSRSNHFDSNEEPRRLHLGVDIWAEEGTPVYNFYDGTVHSFANNDQFGDYGATIILSYELDGFKFNALFGHLSLSSIENLQEGQSIPAGTKFAEFGSPAENGLWPPHLHFQIIQNMYGLKGDYPGVCKYSEREKYLNNCPDPDVILQSTFGSLSIRS